MEVPGLEPCASSTARLDLRGRNGCAPSALASRSAATTESSEAARSPCWQRPERGCRLGRLLAELEPRRRAPAAARFWRDWAAFAASVTSVGLRFFSTVSFVTTHLVTSPREGSSNWTSSRISSRIERRPRAPVSRSSALSAIEPSASSAKCSSIPSKLKKRWNCFTSALRGSVRIRIRSSRVSWWIAEITGSRPTNSGISP